MSNTINTTENTVSVTSAVYDITVTNNNTGTSVNVDSTNTTSVAIGTVGIQGTTGAQGPIGETGPVATAETLIQPFNHITASGNISASGLISSFNMAAVTGSFKHIITSRRTIEFEDEDTGFIIGKLQFDPVVGLSIKAVVSGSGEDVPTNLSANVGQFQSFTVSKSSAADTVDDDFFLIRSGSLEAFKSNADGVMVFGAFTFVPTARAGGVYYNGGDDDFYFGKSS
jgi:hypothetical protein